MSNTDLNDEMPVKKRIVDAAIYIDALRSIVQEGKEVSLVITGSSMNPFLCNQRDTILISKPNRPLEKGDMVFYQRDNGRFIMHRICKVKTSQNGLKLYDIIGDAQVEIEHDVREDQIFGLITKVCRKGKWMEKGDFWWEFFEHVWLRVIPVRRFIMILYAKLTNRKGGEK